MSFTMELTSENLQEITKNSFELAEALNTSVHEVFIANQIYSNLNTTLSEINQKTQTTIALANLTGSSASEMADSLQGLAYQFGISSDKVSELSDALVSIAATTGVEFQRSILNMSQAVSRGGSVAADAGFKYNEFLATVATINEQSRLAGSSISSGLTNSPLY